MNEVAIYPSLKNKIVLITGGASGIGESIVEHFVMQKSKILQNNTPPRQYQIWKIIYFCISVFEPS